MKGLFRSMAARASAGVPSYGMIPPMGSVQTASGLLVSQATAMTVSTVFACVNRIATDLARCTPSLYRLKDDGSKDPVTDHPVLKIFDRPNRQQTWFEFARQMWTGQILKENGYAAIKRDRKYDPAELIPINPDAVMVLESADGSIFYNVNRIGLWQIAMLAEFPTAIAEYDMLHLRGLTFNSLVGASTIGLARDAIGLAMALEQQGNRWIGNGARPSVWLEGPGKLSKDAATRLKTQLDSLAAGVQNTGKTIVLEEGFKPHPLQLNSVDLQYSAQRAFQVLDVCRFFNVPPHKVGVVDRGSVQNIAQQDQDYVNTTIMQRVVMAEQKLRQTFDLDKEEIFVRLNEGQLLRADVLTRTNAARLRVLSGLTTQNEERRAEKMPALPGGDDLLRPQNMAAQGSDLTGDGATGGGRPKDGTLTTGNTGAGESGAGNAETDTPEQN